MNLNLGEATLIPRYLHFFVAALAIGGLFTAAVGLFRWREDKNGAQSLIRFGGKALMYMTMAQIVVGLIFLITLPEEQMLMFMGRNWLATLGLIVGFSGGLTAIFVMSNTLKQEDPRKGTLLTAGIIALVVVFMAIMRDLLRDSYLADFFHPASFVVQTQWDVMLLFFVLFLGGVGLWLLMIKRYFFTPELRVKN